MVTVDLRCAATCTVRTVAGGPAPAHGEGHLVGLGPAPGVASTRAATAAPGAGRGPLLRGVVSLLIGVAVIGTTLTLRARARRRRRRTAG